MASAPTPHCSSITPRPSNATSNNHHHHHRHRHHTNNLKRHENSRWSTTGVVASATPNGRTGCGAAASAAVAAATGTAPAPAPAPAPPFSSSMTSFLGAHKILLAPEFSCQRSTRFVSKIHTSRPRPSSNNHPHSREADEALRCLLRAGNNACAIDNVLLSFENRLCWAGDYSYLIKEFGSKGHYLLATKCYEFAMGFVNGARLEKGKLTSAMISALGRLGKVQDALSLFEFSKMEYGSNVYSFSSMISVFGHNGRFREALSLFRSMSNFGLKPNSVTYNAMIDAVAKGGVEFNMAVMFFEEMVANGIKPDKYTYNSLLSACVPGGLWEVAKKLLTEMEEKGFGKDIYSYNIYLHALCKGGKMDMAREFMEEMPALRIFPNEVTYSTVMDGYAKAGCLEDALHFYDEMKHLSIPFDRVCYNTLVAVYAKLGWFEEAYKKIEEMENSGFTKDVVTYNALLGGYGKHGMYDEVRRIFEEMKLTHRYPNILTYSTVINVYTKGGIYREAMDVYKEFKQEGFEIDVVFYSALIDALCKNGFVSCAMMLLNSMTTEGIRPNVITYNSIIDAFGQSLAMECEVDTSFGAGDHQIEDSSFQQLVAGAFQNQVRYKEHDQIMSMFEQLAAAKAVDIKKEKSSRQDIFSILWLFQKMHELEIKPNVVTFSAILNACSRCNSFGDASKLLDELRLFDNRVYGVVHGLLVGYREGIWFKAQSLFDEIKHMDSSTASAFYNALTDMLWHFGQRRGAQLVVVEGKRRDVWKGDLSDCCLDLHLMSCGAACAMVHSWLLDIRSNVFKGSELPKILSILTGWGKHSKVVGDGTLKRAVESLLNHIGAPFRIAEDNIGRFISPGYAVAAWLRLSSTLNMLALHDDMTNSGQADQVYNLQALCI